jgi:hypothetical protein
VLNYAQSYSRGPVIRGNQFEEAAGELLSRGAIDYDFSQFDQLPAFEMAPIDSEMITQLGCKIRQVHSIAYEWDGCSAVPDAELSRACRTLGSSPLPDRVRKAIVGIVKVLDDRCQG